MTVNEARTIERVRVLLDDVIGYCGQSATEQEEAYDEAVSNLDFLLHEKVDDG